MTLLHNIQEQTCSPYRVAATKVVGLPAVNVKQVRSKDASHSDG